MVRASPLVSSPVADPSIPSRCAEDGVDPPKIGRMTFQKRRLRASRCDIYTGTTHKRQYQQTRRHVAMPKWVRMPWLACSREAEADSHDWLNESSRWASHQQKKSLDLISLYSASLQSHASTPSRHSRRETEQYHMIQNQTKRRRSSCSRGYQRAPAGRPIWPR